MAVSAVALKRRKTSHLSVPAGPEPEDLNLELATLCHALGHTARVRILRLLIEEDCVFGSLASKIPLAQSTVSQHLSVLKSAGLVESETVGRSTAYCVSWPQVQKLKDVIGAL